MRSALVSIWFLSGFAAAAAAASPITVEFVGSVHSVGSAVTGIIEVAAVLLGLGLVGLAVAGRAKTRASC